MVGAVFGWCATVSAQTFYKWTDDSGIVHFSDSPPPQGKGVEERHLPAPPVVSEETPAARSTGSRGAIVVAPAGSHDTTSAAIPEGPARVILVARQNPRTSPSAMHIIGEVKNAGGADAHHVMVAITAVDSTQGTPCLREDVPVMPSTLGPNQTGNFDVDVDSPCLYGDPNVDVTPLWD